MSDQMTRPVALAGPTVFVPDDHSIFSHRLSGSNVNVTVAVNVPHPNAFIHSLSSYSRARPVSCAGIAGNLKIRDAVSGREYDLRLSAGYDLA